MLKIRLQGTLKRIFNGFVIIFGKSIRVDVLEVSDAYANKGTSKYFRVYVVRRKTVNRRKVYV